MDDISEADFSLGSLNLSSDFELSDNEQEGGRNPYMIQLVKEHLIRKFNVRGYDYKVHVEAFDKDTDFTVAVQMLHGILTGKLTLLYVQCKQMKMKTKP